MQLEISEVSPANRHRIAGIIARETSQTRAGRESGRDQQLRDARNETQEKGRGQIS